MTELTVEPLATEPVTDVFVRAQDVTRFYGEGDTAVHALRGVTLDV